MKFLKHLDNKLKDDANFAGDLEEDEKTSDESELSEEELESASGGIRTADPKRSRIV